MQKILRKIQRNNFCTQIYTKRLGKKMKNPKTHRDIKRLRKKTNHLSMQKYKTLEKVEDKSLKHFCRDIKHLRKKRTKNVSTFVEI